MADYILTREPIANIGSFKVVKSISEITSVSSSSTIIVESYTDTDFDFSYFLVNQLRGVMVTRIAYISEQPTRIVEELMKSCGAVIMQDSSVLQDLDSFTELLKEIDSHVAIVDEDFSDIIDSFDLVNQFVADTLATKSRAEGKRVSSALSSVSDTLDRYAFSDTLREELLSFMLTLSNRLSTLQLDLDEKEKELNNLRGSQIAGISDSLSYTTYSHTGKSTILVVKEKTPTVYLTSFLWAFSAYVTSKLDKRSKFVIIERKSPFLDHRYLRNKSSGMVLVDSSNIVTDQSTIFLADNIITTTPTHSVLSTIFGNSAQLYVVLDRSGDSKDLITGRNVYTVSAVSSKSHMRSLGLKSTETILPELGEASQLVQLGYVDGYPKVPEARVGMLQTAFPSAMDNLARYIKFK